MITNPGVFSPNSWMPVKRGLWIWCVLYIYFNSGQTP